MFERLKSYPDNVYDLGRLVNRDDPMPLQGADSVRETHRAVLASELRDLLVPCSHLACKEISQYTHIHRRGEELFKKEEITHGVCRRVRGCIQRRIATDNLNSMGMDSMEIEDAAER